MILISKFSVALGLCLAVIMLGFISASAQTLPGDPSISLDAQSQKIKDKVEKIGLGSNITVVVKGGGKFHGAVANIGDESILVDEVDQKVRVEIKYSEIKKVADGYGPIALGGGRSTIRKRFIRTIIATSAIIGIPLIILVVGMK